MAPTGRAKPLAVRLANLVDATGGPSACWRFLGYVCKDPSRSPDGYGQIRDNAPSRKVLKAHRVALILGSGRDEPSKDACHDCDFTLCCNPDHLFWGTHRYNMLDYIKKFGRLGVSKTDRPAPPRPKLPFEIDDDPVAAACELAFSEEELEPF